eukprot:6904852-Prymnesium_polylepis.1
MRQPAPRSRRRVSNGWAAGGPFAGSTPQTRTRRFRMAAASATLAAAGGPTTGCATASQTRRRS